MNALPLWADRFQGVISFALALKLRTTWVRVDLSNPMYDLNRFLISCIAMGVNVVVSLHAEYGRIQNHLRLVATCFQFLACAQVFLDAVVGVRDVDGVTRKQTSVIWHLAPKAAVVELGAAEVRVRRVFHRFVAEFGLRFGCCERAFITHTIVLLTTWICAHNLRFSVLEPQAIHPLEILLGHTVVCRVMGLLLVT